MFPIVFNGDLESYELDEVEHDGYPELILRKIGSSDKLMVIEYPTTLIDFIAFLNEAAEKYDKDYYDTYEKKNE
jgi:hypothetical protein